MKKIIPFLIMLLLFSGCSSDEPKLNSGTGEQIEPPTGGTIRMGCVPVDTLNPLITGHASVSDVLSVVYEGLFAANEDLTATPVLAKEYSVSRNNTVYTIKLKDSVQFHNGKKLTADDVVATLDYIMIYGGQYASSLSEIQSYNAKKDDTVVIYLKRSISDYVNNLDFPILPAGLTDADFISPAPGFKPVGTGMYKYDKEVEHKKIYLKANEKWHGKKTPYIDTVEVSVLADDETIISAFDVGILDVLTTSWKNMGEMNLTSEMYETFEFCQNRYTYIGLNSDSEIFDSAEKRKRLSDSIDSRTLCEEILVGHAVAAYSPVREGVYFNPDSDKSDDYEATEVTDSKPVECTLLYNSDNKSRVRLASAIKHQLEKRGYVVTLDEQPYVTYCDKIFLDKYDLYIGEVITDNSANLAFMFGSEKRPGRLCNYFDDEFENLVLNLDLMTDKDDKRIAWNNFEEYFKKEAVQVPLYFTNGAVLVNKRISGKLSPNLSGFYFGLENLFIEKE